MWAVYWGLNRGLPHEPARAAHSKYARRDVSVSCQLGVTASCSGSLSKKMLLACLPWLRERQQFTAASTELPTRTAPAACSHGVTADPLPAQRWSAEGGPRPRPRNSSDALLSPGCHGAAAAPTCSGACVDTGTSRSSTAGAAAAVARDSARQEDESSSSAASSVSSLGECSHHCRSCRVCHGSPS